MEDWTRRYDCEVAQLRDGWLVRLLGEIDDVAVPRIEAVLGMIEPASGPLSLDLHAVTFLDGDGIGLLTRTAEAARESGRRLIVTRPSRAVREAFEGGGLVLDEAAVDDAGSRRHALVATDLRGRVTDWNAAAQELYGWHPWEAVGRPITTVAVCPQDESVAREISLVVNRGECWQGCFDVVHRNGHTFSVSVRESLIRGLDGRSIGLMRMTVPADAAA